MIAEALLEVRNLSVRFATERGQVQAVTGLNLTVRSGETLGLVGESGCGKSTTAMALMRLLPRTARVRAASLRFEGRDLLTLNPRELQGLRGNRMAMIFQNPMTSLDPSFTIGAQIVDVLREHRNLPAGAAREAALDLLRRVGIAAAEQRFRAHPHQLSGGQRQRVVIAIALACDPSLLIADEPTTALDVTIQAQILTLLRDIGAERHAAMVLITHDLGVVARMCDRVAVMYAGRLVEEGPVRAIFAEPRHPYTIALLRSIPSGGQARGALEVIEGTVPDLVNPPPGCPFAPRCHHRMAICDTRMPEPREAAPGHRAACFLHGHDHE
ncbi:MAG TPA: ABC transporter ATP-binding protein [Chloroflexota bacterium]|nr:ABC transporter ATP-binding protein [Chloroflexota bacterium]